MESRPETVKVRLLKNNGEANETVFILGATGSGKTTVVANLLLQRERFVIFDVKGEYAPEFFGYQIKAVNDVTNFVEALNDGQSRIVFDLSVYPNQCDQLLNAALLLLFEFQLANKETKMPPVTVALDEFDRFVDSHSAPEGVRDVVQRGRALKIRKIFGAHWFGSIPTWVRDTFSEIYVFRHNDPSGLLRLESFGFDREIVKNLPQHSCLRLDSSGMKQLRFVPAYAAEAVQPTEKTLAASTQQN